MKKIKLFLLILVSIFISGCQKEGCTDYSAINYDSNAKKDNGTCVYQSNNEISGEINSQTWTSDKIYILNGRVIVKNGSTLTIEAGTIIKAKEGTDINASALIIEQGAKIIANGTESKPIIFTSILDNIEVGQLSGSNLDENDAGKWGGLIILGNAPISSANGDTQGQIEGIPATESYGVFGGNNSNDNSGILNYVSIRHSGALIGSGNEINGLTLGGVGSGTTISNIEIIGNLDDGVELFGGTVNISNIVVYFQQDDAIDIDMNYSGTIDNFLTINSDISDKGLEIDGPEGTTNINGAFTLKNGECLKIDGNYATCDFKDKSQGLLDNLILGQIKIRSNFDSGCNSKTDAYSNLINNKLIFTGISFTSVLVYTSTSCSIPVDYQTNVENKIVNVQAIGCNKSVFLWTWVSLNNKI